MDVITLAVGFVLMLALMFLSLPVAVAIIAVGGLGGYLTMGPPMLDLWGGVVWGTLNNSVMTAIPLFMLLGEILLRGGIADRMYDAMAAWLGRLPGGLLHTNIGTCTLFSATSGSSVATAATVGTIALPALQSRGYPVSASLGSLAAGGTLGILIPPSINLLVFGSLANVSVGQLFIAGIVPGILMVALFSLYIAVAHSGAGRSSAAVAMTWRERVSYLKYLVPPLVIFGVVMGGIYGGVTTPTEAAAVAVIVALGFVWHNGKLNFALLEACFRQAARTTGMVILIITCAMLLNVTLAMLGATQAVTQWVSSLGLSTFALLALLVVFYLLLGMFMDAMSMLVLTVPIAVPVVVAVGVDPIWFGIFIIIMCEVALITPPVGMNLFVVQGIRTDGGSFSDVIWGALPYVFIMLGFTFLIMLWPDIVLWLPRTMSGGA